jgi:hypothetical protein
MKNATKSMREMLCWERDLQRNIGETKNAEINNVVYMELYSGAKKVNEKCEIEKSRVLCTCLPTQENV